MKKLLLVAALAACSSHTQALEVRYTGGLAVFGGGLLVAAPAFNGDSLQRNTTVAGALLGAIGVGLLLGSFRWDQPAQ